MQLNRNSRGGIPFGRYLITGKLGAGGMGKVYVAWDEQLSREVVIKLLHRDPSRDERDAAHVLLNEARIVSKIEHPNIVRIYEIGEVAGTLFIVMEYIRGIDLRQLQTRMSGRGRPFPPSLAAGILRQACLGLHAAHEPPSRVIHRDISPGNIMVTADSVKVIDFGLARAMDRVGQSITAGTRIAGCPPYMSPEQIKTPGSVDRRADLFSLAAVLYELCAGQGPFQRDDNLLTMAAVLNWEPQPLRELCPEAPPELEGLVAAALSKDPDRRPGTAQEVALRLRELAGPRFVHHEDIVAYLRSLGVELKGAEAQPLASADEQELLWRAHQAAGVASITPAPPRTEPLARSAAVAPGAAPTPQVVKGGVPLQLPTTATMQELISDTGGRIHCNTLHLDQRSAREPMTLPLDLAGLVAEVRYPLLLLINDSMFELRVPPALVTASRAVRIYSELTSAAARNTLALPVHTDGETLYVGHHRGPSYPVHAVVRSRELCGQGPLRAELDELGIFLDAPAEARSLLVLWRQADPSNPARLVHLVAVTV